MIYFGLLGLAIAIGVPLAAFGCGLAQGKAAAAALEGMARQPESHGNLQTAMILSLAFIESLVIFSFVVLLMMKGSLPDVATAIGAIKGQ
jgi:F-type H+-transporting ATPase subunit c